MAQLLLISWSTLTLIMRLRQSTILAAFLFFFHSGYAQVGELKKELEEIPSTLTSGTQETTDIDCDDLFLFELFWEGVFALAVLAQEAALEDYEDHRKRISLELDGAAGLDFVNHADYIRSEFRANWGAFGSRLNYIKLSDVDNLETLEWQWLFRIPIEDVNIEYGLGFSKMLHINRAHFKQSAGIDYFNRDLAMNFRFTYEWFLKDEARRIRRNLNFRVDKEMVHYSKLHISPMAEYGWTNYLNNKSFHTFSVGAVVRLY